MSDSRAGLLAQQAWHEDGVHFLRAVTDMADRRRVVAVQAIYTDKGVKLLDKGARIDSRVYAHLVEHKLRDPVEKYLSVDGCVDVQEIGARAVDQIETMELMRRMARALDGAQRLLAPVRQIVLPPQLAFKLTVMREQRPGLFAHSIQMMLVAVYLAQKNGWSGHDCAWLAAAALLHDVGMLHMDPAWTDTEHWLTGTERRHLVAHSVTGMLIVRNCGVYPQAVEMAVLDHHERMDGSGYPRGSRGDAISTMGQVLLLAEVVAAFYDKFRDLPGQRLSLMLRMNHRCYPAHLVRHVLPLLYDESAPGAPLQPLQAEFTYNVTALSAVFQLWRTLSRQFPERWQDMPDHQAAIFIDSSLRGLQKQLAEAGLHPGQQSELLAFLQDDAQGMGELALVSREARWQLQAIVNACLHRWPDTGARRHALDAAVMEWCEASLRIDAVPPLQEPAGNA